MPALSLPSWYTSNDYHRVKIGPYILGDNNGMMATIPAVHTKRIVDHQRGAGVDGGGKIYKGIESREFRVEVTIYDHLGELSWEELARILMPMKVNGAWTAWPVDHPLLARHGVRSAMVVDIFDNMPGQDGTQQTGLMMVEYLNRVSGAKKPTPKSTSNAVPVADLAGGKMIAAPFLPEVTPPSKRRR